MSELNKHKITINPKWKDCIVDYLHESYMDCIFNGRIEYENHCLGWYPFQGQEYYFFDKTDFNGTKATTDREKMLFQSGNRNVYMQFLQDTVFPSTVLSLALTIGYSAVVVSRLRKEFDLGTIIVNLCGISSTGKSTAEMLMCSPFMCPEINDGELGLNLSSNATQNGLFASIDGIHGVPFVVDDITTNPNINLTQYIYTIAEGRPKARCNSDGTLRGNGLGWSGVAITSSELPILHHAMQNQGLKVRVLHTEGIQWTEDATQAEHIKEVVRKNYGFTGKEFADFVATIPMEDLKKGFKDSYEYVNALMVKRDNLTSRLANKYAAIHLTAVLLNQAFGYGLSENDIIARFIKCEQDEFEARDNATKGLDCITDFILQNQSHFDCFLHYEEQNYHDTIYAKGEHYGRIFKYDDKWKVYLLSHKVDKILLDNNLPEIRAIRKKWAVNGFITEIDGEHTAKKYTFNKDVGRKRYVCFVFEGGISMPYEDYTPTQSNGENVKANVIHAEPPKSDYAVDDEEIINNMFGGGNNE